MAATGVVVVECNVGGEEGKNEEACGVCGWCVVKCGDRQAGKVSGGVPYQTLLRLRLMKQNQAAGVLGHFLQRIGFQ